MAKKATYEELEVRIRELEQETQSLRNSLKLLSKKEQAIQALVNAPTGSALLVEPEQGVILACNEVAAQSLNITVEGLVGLSIYDALSSDLANSRRKQAEKVVRSGKPVRFQDRRDGRTHDINVYPVLGSRRKVTHVAVFAQDVTERIKNEEALKEGQQRYRLLVENQNDLIVKVDTQYRFLYVSPSYCETFGKTEEELLGKRFMPLIHEDDRDMVANSLKRLFQEPYTCYHEERALTKNGWRWLAWSGRAELNDKGQVEAVLAIGRDITDRKQAEEALELSEARLRAAIDCLPFDFFVIGKNGRYEMANAVCRKLWGNLIGKRPEDLSGDSKNLALWEENNRRALSGETVKGEVELNTNGEKGYYYNIISPVKSKDEILGILGVNIDITRLKRTEEALKESEKRNRELVETMNEGLAVIDTNMLITFVNEKFSQMLGYARDEMIGRSALDLHDEPNQKIFKEQIVRRRRGEHNPYEIAFIRKDGEQVFAIVSPKPMLDAQGRHKGSFAVVTDITERKRAEKAMRESEEKYRTLVEQSQEGIAIFQGFPRQIVFANRAVATIFGYHIDELMSISGEDIGNLVHCDDQDMIMKRLSDRLKGREVPSRYEVRGIRKDGRVLWLDVSATRITYQGMQAAQATFIDITDRKLAEQELQKAHDELETRVKERTAELSKAFKELRGKSQNLEEANTALKVLLEKRDGDRIELEDKLIANVNQLVEPYLEKLKNTNLDERQKAFLKIVETNLKDIASPFLKSLDRQHLKLTPTEIQVAELVKQGKSAKEIADLMNLSWKTIKTHRRNIRSKLNLKNKKTNLRSYLMSYQQ
jgi:PAS domain S-box-containing protein